MNFQNLISFLVGCKKNHVEALQKIFFADIFFFFFGQAKWSFKTQRLRSASLCLEMGDGDIPKCDGVPGSNQGSMAGPPQLGVWAFHRFHMERYSTLTKLTLCIVMKRILEFRRLQSTRHHLVTSETAVRHKCLGWKSLPIARVRAFKDYCYQLLLLLIINQIRTGFIFCHCQRLSCSAFCSETISPCTPCCYPYLDVTWEFGLMVFVDGNGISSLVFAEQNKFLFLMFGIGRFERYPENTSHWSQCFGNSSAHHLPWAGDAFPDYFSVWYTVRNIWLAGCKTCKLIRCSKQTIWVGEHHLIVWEEKRSCCMQ